MCDDGAVVCWVGGCGSGVGCAGVEGMEAKRRLATRVIPSRIDGSRYIHEYTVGPDEKRLKSRIV